MAAREKEAGPRSRRRPAARPADLARAGAVRHRSAGRAAPFRIAPREMQQISQGLPLKPTQYDPHDVRNFADVNGDGDISEKEQANFDNALALMKDVAYVPTQKGLFPATEAQEQGWLVSGGGLAALERTVGGRWPPRAFCPRGRSPRLRGRAPRRGGAPVPRRGGRARPRAAAAAAARGAPVRGRLLDADTLLLTRARGTTMGASGSGGGWRSATRPRRAAATPA